MTPAQSRQPDAIRTTLDGGTIRKQVLLRASRSRAWQAIASVKEFSQWFGVHVPEGEFAPGARLHMQPTSPDMGGDFHLFIEAVEPQRLFSWRWHPGARDPQCDYSAEPTTLVVFELADAPGGTLLTITESGLDRISLARRAKVFSENDEGWNYQIKSLERYVNAAS
jgi:uncharacterized protein YndB with AHSA1/START domain